MWMLIATIGMLVTGDFRLAVFTTIAEGYYCAHSRVAVGDDVPSAAKGPLITTVSIAKIVEKGVDVGWI